MLQHTADRPKVLKSECPAVHIYSKLYDSNARPTMLFFNFLVIMHGCAHMHDQPCIILSLQFLRFLSSCGLISPLSLLSHNYSLIIEALSSRFFEFGPRYLKRVGLTQNNVIVSAGDKDR